jgi:hypothetical protein
VSWAPMDCGDCVHYGLTNYCYYFDVITIIIYLAVELLLRVPIGIYGRTISFLLSRGLIALSFYYALVYEYEVIEKLVLRLNLLFYHDQ